jgi:hypothetical protein
MPADLDTRQGASAILLKSFYFSFTALFCARGCVTHLQMWLRHTPEFGMVVDVVSFPFTLTVALFSMTGRKDLALLLGFQSAEVELSRLSQENAGSLPRASGN